MENILSNTRKGGQEEEYSVDSLHKDLEICCENVLDSSELKSRRLVKRVNSQRTLILTVKQLLSSQSSINNFFLRSTHGLDTKIPKHMVTLDERYLRRCLELIHNSASKAAPCNITVNLGSAKMGLMWDDMNPAKSRTENACDLARFIFECPMAAGTGSVVVSPARQWIVGSIMGSKSMINILKSPLLSKLGELGGDGNFVRKNWNDVKGSISYDFVNSPGGFSGNSSQKLETQNWMRGNHKHGSETGLKRLASVSSTNSTCSDRSSSSASASTSLGVLQCTWDGGILHFIFSVDDRTDVFMANLSKSESADGKSLDYMYSIHQIKGGQKKHEICYDESLLVGKMKVSISFSLCPNNSKIMETQFTLFGSNETFVGGMQTSGHDTGKGLSKKVVEVFRTTQSFKKRTLSKFGGSSAVFQNSSWEPCQNLGNNDNALGGASLLENHPPPNLELAAIVVKDHLPTSGQKEVGGWGLKFLKKVGVKQTVDPLKTSVPSACCARDTGDCSTSTDIIIPAGFHGGSRTRNGGPSGLIERWRSGGCCDCGGWDLGCTLTLLSARLSKKDVLSQTDMDDEYKSFDLFVQGSEHGGEPTWRMVNVRDGLYFIHFQSSLSALQSFSIALAYIHSRSPTELRFA